MPGKAEGWPDLAGRFDGHVHRLGIRVYYEDTDFSGVVYHASYLRFCERGRSDFLRLSGAHHAELASGGAGESLAFAVRHMDIDFLKPARIDDVLEVETGVAQVGGATISLWQRVMRGGDVLFKARVKAVIVNGAGKPRRLPQGVRDTLSRLSAGPAP